MSTKVGESWAEAMKHGVLKLQGGGFIVLNRLTMQTVCLSHSMKFLLGNATEHLFQFVARLNIFPREVSLWGLEFRATSDFGILRIVFWESG